MDDKMYTLNIDDMLIVQEMSKILERDDKNISEDIFIDIQNNISYKNDIPYYEINKDKYLMFDENLYLNNSINKTLNKKISVDIFLADILSDENNIIGYTTLNNSNFKGNILKIGQIEGYNLANKKLKKCYIYNRVPTIVKGFLPVIINEKGEEKIKYLLVCSIGAPLDIVYKVAFWITFIGVGVYYLWDLFSKIKF